MKEQTIFKSGANFLVVGALLVIIIGGVHLAQAVLMPFLISIFLSILGVPILRKLSKRGVPLGVGVLIVIFGIIFVLAVIGLIIGNFTNSLLTALPVYQERLHEHVNSLVALLGSKGIKVSEDTFTKSMNAEDMTALATGFLGSIGSLVSNIVVILLMVSFILMEASTFPSKIRAAVETPRAAFPGFSKFMQEMPRFMIFQTVYGLITGIITSIWLAIFGVDFAIMIGLITFFLCYIPNIGSAIALVLIVAVSFIQLGPANAGILALGYLLFTFVLGSIIQPRLMGKMLGLSTLVVFLSVIFWGNLLGPVGAMLCVPLTMALKFGLESNENTKWIGVLLERGSKESKRKKSDSES